MSYLKVCRNLIQKTIPFYVGKRKTGWFIVLAKQIKCGRYTKDSYSFPVNSLSMGLLVSIFLYKKISCMRKCILFVVSGNPTGY